MVAADLISFANRLADLARQETLRQAGGSMPVQNKGSVAEFDPVTEADRNAERAMREAIEKVHPDHGIAGEEFGETHGSSRYQWMLDPIDGTRSYTCGLPTWTTLIALLDDGDPVLGIIDAPAVGERYVGCSASATLSSGGSTAPLRVSGCTSLTEARLSTTDPFLFTGPAGVAFERLRKAARTTRYGHDAYGYARLAAGTLDLVVECKLKPHDYAALIPVVHGAGGVFGDWSGGSDFAAGNVIAAATPQLYDAVVEIMKSLGRVGGAPEGF
jgi:myo-inositol-1(or 4)-monophosphatase